jgi:hypothetical protein
MASTVLPEVAAHALQTVRFALKTIAANVHLTMASTVTEAVARAFQTVLAALIKIIAADVHLTMASTLLPEAVSHALQTV